MHIKQDIKLLSLILLFIAALMCIPMCIGIHFKETVAVQTFALTIVFMAVMTSIPLLVFKNDRIDNLNIRDGFFFVSFTWILATAFGALPLYFGTDSFESYSAAYFEIMSGFSTTGATTMVDIDACAKSILFWRSMTNWLGGMGIVVLFVAVLPLLRKGAGAFFLYGAESVGPTKDKITAKTKNTALVLWAIYLGLSLFEVIFLLFGGLSLYEAVTVTFSTVSAAGFCVHNGSIGSFNSAYVDVVCTVFMMLAGSNFALYFKILKGKPEDFFRNREIKAYYGIFAVASVLGAIQLTAKHVYGNFFTSLRYTAFHIASVITTTGFTTANYLTWPTFSIMLIIIMMFIGGCSGSTGGGIKVTRIVTLFDMGKRSVLKKLHPHAVSKVRGSDGVVYDSDTLLSVCSFVACYIITWLMGALIVSLSGLPIIDCLSASILTLGNIGIGFGEVGMTSSFTAFPDWALWIFSFLMLCGRLELLTVYVLFSRSFWRK